MTLSKAFLFILLFLNINLIAQTNADPEKTVKEYFKQLNALSKNQDPDIIMNMLTEDFVEIDYNNQLDSLKRFRGDLDDIVETATVHPENNPFYKYEKTVKVFTHDSVAIVFCNVSYKYLNRETNPLHSYVFYSFVLRKIGIAWKIECIAISNNIAG